MPHCEDSELAVAVSQALAAGATDILVSANGYQAALSARSRPADPWALIGVGDLDGDTATALVPLARGGHLYWHDVIGSLEALDPAAFTPTKATGKSIQAWRARRDKLTKPSSGRTGEVSTATQREVERLAAWRCQFDGCGEDLRTHPASAKTANYSYLAHIVASSVDGPRGNAQESAVLADEPTNIMLLCDKCHRRIDRVEPDAFPAESLRSMRERSIREVDRLLGALRHPAAHILVVGGYIEGQNAGFNQRFAEEAMWGRRLRAATSEPMWFLRNGGNLPDSTHEHYWGALFQTLPAEVAALQGYMNGTSRGGEPCSAMAVFPTHVTSILVLAGRLLGNSTTVHLFQPNRNAPPGTPGERWAWPSDASAPTPDKYQLTTLVEHAGQREAAMLVYLTADLPAAELPAALATMPTLELRAAQPHHGVIGTQKDLDSIGGHLDDALRRLQDEWRVQRVHVLVLAPAAACVLLGQKLQARHHANTVLYERRRVPPGQARGPFVPTIEIGGRQVQLVSTPHRVPLG